MRKLESHRGFKGLEIVSCVIMIMCLLTGCQLARADAGEENEKSRDRLVGVFVTTEYLDLFDAEQWLKDNPDLVMKGKNVTVDEADPGYYGRLYATLVSHTLYDAETGEAAGETEKYELEGVDGILYICATMTDDEGSHISPQSDEGISDGKLSIHTSDEGEAVTMTGTVYVTPAIAGKGIYINPVYQEPDGGVYVVSGHGMTSNYTGEGGIFSQKYEDSVTVAESGKAEQSSRISIEISISITYPPEKLAVTQMDGDNRIVSREEYAAGQTPETIKAQADAEYMIVETHRTVPDGGTVEGRELYLRGEDGFYTLVRGDNGIYAQHWTAVEWE